MAGLWGNHEGSLLLWVTILAIYGAAVAAFGDNLPLAACRPACWRSRPRSRLGFLAFMLFTSNPFLRARSGTRRGAGAQPDPAGPGPRLSSAHPLSGLCRPLHGLLLRRGRADRGPGRCRLGALGQALDAGRLDLPYRRHRRRQLVGLSHAGLGRLVVLGSGRERLVHALAGGHRPAPLGHRGGEARRPEGLDDPARHLSPSPSA